MAESKQQQSNQERRFNQEQYDMLKRCSEKKDMTEWNEWRNEHSEYDVQDVLLEGGDFSNWHLEGVNLGTHRQYGRNTPEVYLRRAKFNNAHIEGAQLCFANMEGVELHKTHLEKAILMFARFDNALLLGVHLEDANLKCAKLHNTNVCNAHLDRADFVDSELQDSEFDNAYLIGAKFRKARVIGSTSFCFCEVDRETDFREVGLGSVRIDSAKKQLLEYNIRRMNWEEWYPKQNRLLRWIVRAFWWVSDYGISSPRIIKVFLVSVIAFAGIYYLWGRIAPPGIVDYLFVDGSGVEVAWWLVPIRAIHFSVVIMTVGFTNMHANAHSFWAHIIVSLQMILGFVLLGALVTRFAVLFTAGGPAGKFADEKKKATEDTEKNK